MAESVESPFVAPNRTAVARRSDRELAVTRLFDAPPPIVFRAWSEAALFRRWWVPEGAGITLVGCEMDVRTGGSYRLEFAAGDETMAFYGKYLEVVPGERIVWTNDEGEAGAVTTVTFQAQDGRTLLTFHERYPDAAALDEAMDGSAAGLPIQLDQLGALLPALGG
ncbi:SRPBCC domain-containing protein [Sphingomonas sp. RS6]